MPKKTELAYIAGVFDGEGTIGVYPTGKSGKHVLYASLKMCDPEAIGVIQDTFGTGTCSGYQGINAYVYRLIFRGERACAFLKAIRMFLRVKAEQADWAIEFHETCRPGKGHKLTSELLTAQKEYAAQLRSLKVLPYAWEVCHP